MDKECRPRALLAFKIRLPELVFILALNPDVRDLFSFVPRSVLFVICISYKIIILYIVPLSH